MLFFCIFWEDNEDIDSSKLPDASNMQKNSKKKFLRAIDNVDLREYKMFYSVGGLFGLI